MTSRSYPSNRMLLVSAGQRIARAWPWVVIQIAGIPLLIACAMLWTRIPEKHGYQVLMTLVAPILIFAAFLALQGGTMRSLLRSSVVVEAENRTSSSAMVSFAWGALSLALWIAIGWLLWMLIDRFDMRTSDWAGYLNSRFPAGARARMFTYSHLLQWLGYAGWFLRWVVVPGLLIPLGCSALFGLRHAPWARMVRVWAGWRWWPATLVLALLGGAWPQTFFDAQPTGTVHAQVWRVALKLVAAFVLAIVCWLVALAWCATLVAESGSARASIESGPLQGRPLARSGLEGDVSGNA